MVGDEFPIFWTFACKHDFSDLIILFDHGPLEILILVIPELTLPEHFLLVIAVSDFDYLREGGPADRCGRPSDVKL